MRPYSASRFRWRILPYPALKADISFVKEPDTSLFYNSYILLAAYPKFLFRDGYDGLTDSVRIHAGYDRTEKSSKASALAHLMDRVKLAIPYPHPFDETGHTLIRQDPAIDKDEARDRFLDSAIGVGCYVYRGKALHAGGSESNNACYRDVKRI